MAMLAVSHSKDFGCCGCTVFLRKAQEANSSEAKRKSIAIFGKRGIKKEALIQ